MKVSAQHFIPLERHNNRNGISTSKSAVSLTPEQIKLKKACQNFEAIFISYMLKTMRQESEKSNLFGNGLGSDIYKEMFDEKLAEQMSESGQMKIGDILYNQYAPIIQATDTTKGLKKTPTIEDKPVQPAIEGRGGLQTRPNSPQAKAAAEPPISSNESLSSGPRRTDKTISNNLAGHDPEIRGLGSSSQNEMKAAEPDKPAEISKPATDKTKSTSLLSNFEDLISQAAEKFGLQPALIKAVIQHESGGNPNAVSPDGAKGLMQLVDGTAKMMGVIDPFNPVQNIMGGAKYISQLWEKFGGDLKKVIASYNAGPGAVEKFNGVPPYKETLSYVDKVLATYDMENNRN